MRMERDPEKIVRACVLETILDVIAPWWVECP